MEAFGVKSLQFGLVLALVMAVLLCLTNMRVLAQDENDTAAQSESGESGGSRQLRESDVPPAGPSLKIENEESAESAETAAPVRRVRSAGGGQTAAAFTYTVRSGDSLSAIAQIYGLDVSDLARANRLSEDSILQTGQVLRIPNPFAAQIHRLEKTVEQLNAQIAANRGQVQSGQAKVQTLSEQVDELQRANHDLEHGVRVLPWWRGFAVTAGVGALLMLGITALTMLEWFMLRRRFQALASMNESIRRLDQKYRVALSKAELRLQQIYGRRRAQSEDLEKAKLPEQIEIDRLNEQLKELLQEHLERLGLSHRARRRGRLRDLFFGVESPVEARAGRR
jgi:LysM repeat protein